MASTCLVSAADYRRYWEGKHPAPPEWVPPKSPVWDGTERRQTRERRFMPSYDRRRRLVDRRK